MFKKYFRVSKQDGKPRTSYIYDSSQKTDPKKSTVDDGSSMLQTSVLTREASVIKVSEQSLKEWNNSNYNAYGEPIISRRTSARHTNRSNGGSIFSLSLPDDEMPRTDGESELSPRSGCSGIHTELIKLSLEDYLTATQSCEVIKVKSLPYHMSERDSSNATELTRAPHSLDSLLISNRRTPAEIRRRSFRCENLLPRKQLNLSTDFTDFEMDPFEQERGNSKDHNEGSGYLCREECMSWDDKLSTAESSRSGSKDLHLQANFENLERKLSSANFDRLKTFKAVPESRWLNNVSKTDEETKKPSLTDADSAILNKLFAALSKITELEGDLDQVKEFEKAKKQLKERTKGLEKSIEEMEKGFQERKVTWENQIEEYKNQIQQYESQISQLRKKHNEEIESRDIENKGNVRKLKRDHLQAMADLRKTLTNWSENIDSTLETQKKENETLKKKLQARKVRQEELEAEIAKLETDCNCEAKEALRLTKELVEAREQINILKIAPVRQKSVHKSLEKEYRDLRSSHTDLQDVLQKKEETEKETLWEVQCLTLECERLQGVVMDLRRELSVYKSGRVSYSAIELEKHAQRKKNIKISRGHCRARSEAINAFQGGKLLVPNARIFRTSIDECTERTVFPTNQMVLPECRKTRSCQQFPPSNRNKWMRSSMNTNSMEISEDERSCSRGDLRLRVGNTRTRSISQVNSRPWKEDSLFDSDSETTHTCRRKAGSFTISTLLKDVNLLLPEDGAHSASSDDSDSENELDSDCEFTLAKKNLKSPNLSFLKDDKSASQHNAEMHDVVFPAQFI